MDEVLKQLKSHDAKIIMRDFNSKVGKGRIDNIVGPYGLGEISERGEKLVEWCKQHELVVTNTWFANHPRRRWTWTSPGDRVRNQIDYILVQQRFRNSIQYSEAMTSAYCNSDHNPVLCRMQIKLKCLKKSKSGTKYQLDMLRKDQNIKSQFSISVQNEFEMIQEATSAEEKLNLLRERVLKNRCMSMFP